MEIFFNADSKPLKKLYICDSLRLVCTGKQGGLIKVFQMKLCVFNVYVISLDSRLHCI